MQFTVSNHAFQKHLVNSDSFDGASVFFSKEIMMNCIRECVNRVKEVDGVADLNKNKKHTIEHQFDFAVGRMANGKLVNRIKVIYKCLKTKLLVITAYPIS